MFLELKDKLPRIAAITSIGFGAVMFLGALIYTARVHARTEQATMCLAENLYHEARGEDSASQRLIGAITLARLTDALQTKRAPAKTLCGIVGADKQFSWTLDYRLATKRTEQEKWKQAQEIARDLIAQARSGELTLPKGWECARYYKRTDDVGVSENGKKFFERLSSVGKLGRKHTAYKEKRGCTTPFPTAG